MATTDVLAESLFTWRVAMIEELGFSTSDAMLLAEAKKIVANEEAGRTYFYEIPLSWHDVAKLQEAGATEDQILRILL